MSEPEGDPTEWERLRRGMKRDGFSPIDNPEIVRRNSKTQIIVERDGSMRERVHLQVARPDHREQLIFLHYLRHYARCFLTDAADGILPHELGVNLLSRDAPWDFELQLSTGEQFFVEITALGDNRYQLEHEKREERMLLAAQRPTIRVRDLRKLASFFACQTSDVALALHAKTPADLVVPNPFHGEDSRIITGAAQPPDQPLATQIIEAVNRKAAKRHLGKDRTVLILDYRSNYARSDGMATVAAELEDYLGSSPFPEVWIYVGYFSDDDGNNAEFSFSPLKLSGDKAARLASLHAQKGVDSFGRVIW